MLKGLFKYPGSKRKLFKKYLELGLIPERVLQSYSEPFLGSGAVMYNLINLELITSKTSVKIGDLSEEIVSLFKYLQETDLNTICEDIRTYSVLENKLEHEELINRFKKFKEPLCWLQLISNSFLGTVRASGKYYPGSFKKKVFDNDNLFNWSKVLKTYDIEISCSDYSKIPVCEFNFVDPPYIESDKGMYFSSDENLMKDIFTKYVGSHSIVCNKYSNDWEKSGYPVHTIDLNSRFYGKEFKRTEVAIEFKPFPSERKALALTI